MYYTYYNGTDEYSNGDIEDELLNIVKNNKEYDKTINETDSFAVFYHLSKNIQKNLVLVYIKYQVMTKAIA